MRRKIKGNIWKGIYQSRSAGILPEWLVWLLAIAGIVGVIIVSL